jgi:CRP/FNR family cyclic AMP-dependent transcriptional regulator
LSQEVKMNSKAANVIDLHSEVRQCITKVPLLESLSEVEKEALIPKIRISLPAAGKYIIREGAPQSELIFVVSGQLKVTKSSGPQNSRRKKEVILSLLYAGDFFGEIALLTGSNRSADVVTLVPSVILSLSGEDFFHHIDRYPGLSKRIMSGMAARISRASQRITDLSLFDVPYRLTKMLWNMGEIITSQGKQISYLSKPPTHKMAASMIGSSREVISRSLKMLINKGLVMIDGRGLIIKPWEEIK